MVKEDGKQNCAPLKHRLHVLFISEFIYMYCITVFVVKRGPEWVRIPAPGLGQINYLNTGSDVFIPRKGNRQEIRSKRC